MSGPIEFDETSFWIDKILNFLHDPWDKAFGISGHDKRSLQVIRAIFGEVDSKYALWHKIYDALESDTEAAAADRPVFASGNPNVDWSIAPRITHPLTPAHLSLSFTTMPENAGEWLERIRPRLQLSNLNASELRDRYFWLWRALLEELERSNGEPNDSSWREINLHLETLWPLLPADTRIPDHSIWDHLRMTSAWAGTRNKYFRKKGGMSGNNHPPMLVTIKVGSAQSFISEARKSRDLWIGSYLLSDLTLHALIPIVETLGPDSILYPSLYGNPLFDQYLADRHTGEGALRSVSPNERPLTYSSMLPNRFVALVPHALLDELTGQSRKSMEGRWSALVNVVRGWIQERVSTEPAPWQEIFDRQTRPPAYRWTAVPWEGIGYDPDNDEPIDAEHYGEEIPSWKLIPDEERQRQEEIWNTYYGVKSLPKTKKSYLVKHRAFTYPAIHHELLIRMNSLPQLWPQSSEGIGVKCQVDGWREALHCDGSKNPPLGKLRQAAQDFWLKFHTAETASGGTQRPVEVLSGPSAVRRFLLRADEDALPEEVNDPTHISSQTSKILHRFTDPNELSQRVENAGAFPSTHLIAAAKWLEDVIKRVVETDPDVPANVDKFHDAAAHFLSKSEECLKTLDEDNQIARSHRTVRRIFSVLEKCNHRCTDVIRRLFRFNPEWLLPDSWERLTDEQLGNADSADSKRAVLMQAADTLYGLMKDFAGRPMPRTYAILMMDGDGMGKLLAGLEGSIEATYRDILHPEALQLIGKDPMFQAAGWPNLFGKKRLMTPALHGFVTRALAHFAYEVVPWLVEEKYHGRLIYAGGDDLLALVPTEEALDLAWQIRCHFGASFLKGDWRWSKSKEMATEFTPAGAFNFILPGEHPDPGKWSDPSSSQEVNPGDRIVPMLGSSGKISASIVYAPVKTPIRPLLNLARERLEHDAKELLGRDAVVLSRYSRSGEKYRLGGKWRAGYTPVVQLFNALKDGFASEDGWLSGRFPYKLRSQAAWLFDAPDVASSSDSDHPDIRVAVMARGEATNGTSSSDSDHTDLLEKILPRLISSELERRSEGLSTERGAYSEEESLQHIHQVLQLIRWNLTYVDAVRRDGPDETPASPIDGLLLARWMAGNASTEDR